jgi:hypothetical protein
MGFLVRADFWSYRPPSSFTTTDVENLYTMIPRVGALEVLARFCIKHSKQGKIGTFAIDHTMKMARLILDKNCFMYNNKYYLGQSKSSCGATVIPYKKL